ncbi:MAG TPA: YajQ family cyclic di-GMP-binding protein [Chloroflexota bacterium]|nr:YajQ family cyclic di-GMP-binding protein [Chloroflexota bacterium]
MAAESSFDVVSEFDRQELVNAVDQAEREIRTRYDLKDTKSEIRLDKETLVLQAPAEITLNSVRDLLESKMVRRGLSLKILKVGPVEHAAHGSVRQTITLQRGISQELARDITKVIREAHPKAKAQVQGDAVRVSAKSKDELQSIIALLKAKDYPVPLQFTNYR